MSNRLPSPKSYICIAFSKYGHIDKQFYGYMAIWLWLIYVIFYEAIKMYYSGEGIKWIGLFWEKGEQN